MSATAFIQPAGSESFRLGLFSDTHYWPGGGAFFGGDGSLQLLGWSEQLLASVMDELANANADLIIHLGDVTCGGGHYPITEEEYHQVQAATHEAITSRNIPAFALPGNHDCPPGGGLWTDFEQRWHLRPGQGQTLDTPYARLVLLNAQGHSPAQVDAARPADPIYGWVSDAELARLDEALAAAGELPVILFLHQLLRPRPGDTLLAGYYFVANAEDVNAVLVRHGNVRAIFQGHAHRFDVQSLSLGGKPCLSVVTPAIMLYPVGWLAVTLSAAQMRVQLRPLPLPALIQQSLDSGDGQAWRAGLPEWHDFTIQI